MRITTWPLWIPRLLIVGAILPHAITKFIALDSFSDKFNLSLALSTVIAVVELLGCIGFIVGGLLSHYKYEIDGIIITILSVIALSIIQVGAIIMFHWANGWFYFRGGIEYNIILLGIMALVLINSYYCNKNALAAENSG